GALSEDAVLKLSVSEQINTAYTKEKAAEQRKDQQEAANASDRTYQMLERGEQKPATMNILAAKLFSAPYAREYDLKKLALQDEAHILIAQYIIAHEASGERIRPSELFEFLEEDSEELNAIFEFNYEDELSGTVAERFFLDSAATLESEAIEREIARLNEEYKNAAEDEEKRKSVAQQLACCVQRKNALKNARK
ncbi:MAG: hypothetical protein IJX88_03885, partial [Clostridia bacterium]|nr:hypothetical protein [Clostridia bacterium]